MMNKKYLYSNDSETKLNYTRSLNIDAKTHSLRRPGIVCTIGTLQCCYKLKRVLLYA